MLLSSPRTRTWGSPGEGYQEPTTFRIVGSQVVKGVNEMSQVQTPNSDHCI